MKRGLLVIVPLALALWWWSRPSAPTGSSSVSKEPATPMVDLASWRGLRPAPPAPRRAPPPPAAAPSGKPGRPLDLYLAQSKYPPTSRPLSRERNPDLIEWNSRSEENRISEHDPTVDYLYSADLLFVIGDRPITTFLRVRRDGVPVDVKITQAFVTVEAQAGDPLPPEAREAIPIVHRFEEGQYLATFRPADHAWIQRAVDLVFHVEFDYGGRTRQRAVLAAGYTPKAAAPARFTGQLREAIEEGSLVVYAGVEVFRGGWYNFDANLWDGANRPVAWTRHKGDLQPGMREVRLLFFGKVLTDARAPSPWSLGELRGFRYNAEAAPAEELLEPFAARYTTKRYALSQLSSDEWNAPERDRQIQALLADEATGQAPPLPAAAFENEIH